MRLGKGRVGEVCEHEHDSVCYTITASACHKAACEPDSVCYTITACVCHKAPCEHDFIDLELLPPKLLL